MEVQYIECHYYGTICLLGTVGRDVTVTERCVIGAGCDVSCKETLSQDTIIYGADCRRYHKKAPLQVNLRYS